jgi:hypothetical protein
MDRQIAKQKGVLTMAFGGPVERLKNEVSLERLVTGFGVELKRHGTDLLGPRPFRDERE